MRHSPERETKRQLRKAIKQQAKEFDTGCDRASLDQHTSVIASELLNGQTRLEGNETVFVAFDGEAFNRDRALAVFKAHFPPRSLAQVARITYYAAICELVGADIRELAA
mgnify:CR=1 FL=1